MERTRINLNCPKCAQQLTVLKPDKPGVYQLTCNKCSHQFTLQLRAVPVRTEGAPQKEDAGSPNKKKVRVLGEPKLHDDGKYRIAETALVNRPYGCICPKCQKTLLFMPRQEGAMAVKCEKCATSIIFKAATSEQKPAATGQDDTTADKPAAGDYSDEKTKKNSVVTRMVRPKGNQSRGMLSWGNIFSRKKYVLDEGKTVVGRNDQDAPSDIELKDKTVSRRSVEIDVTQKDGGYFFKFTVMRAANPVYVNYKEIGLNESIYLTYGDVIQLGQTLINFTKAQ